MAPPTIKDFVETNGTKLYYEVVGAGPAALFIAGSTGDAGNFTRAAGLLANDFRVVTIDVEALLSRSSCLLAIASEPKEQARDPAAFRQHHESAAPAR